MLPLEANPISVTVRLSKSVPDREDITPIHHTQDQHPDHETTSIPTICPGIKAVSAHRCEFRISHRCFATDEQSCQSGPYRPLSTDSAEIRILELLPGVTGSLVCRLHHRLIGSAKFEALSYAWTNSTSHDREITIDGRSVMIRQSLAEAMLRFRLHDVSRFIWIDAICINQADKQEKSRQVLLMRDIYATSTRTLIRLGPADTSTAEGFSAAKKRASITRQNAAQGRNDEMPQTVGVFWTGFFENREWYALSNLHTRSWFQRAWIVQEVTVAVEATVVCGEYEMDWIDLVVGNQDIQFASSYLHRLGRGILKYASPTREEDLTAVLARNKQRQATLSADKIYAFVGLVDVNKRHGILPDYNRSEEDLLLRLTLDSIATRGDLGIFSVSTQPDLTRNLRPSWVLNTSYDISRDTLASESFAWRAYMWGGTHFPIFNACAGPVARPLYSEKDQSLTLRGVKFDEVLTVGNRREGYRQVLVKDYWGMLQKWPEKVTDFICYINWRNISQVHDADDTPDRDCARQAFWETANGGVIDRYQEQAKTDWELIDNELEFLWRLPASLSEWRPLIYVFSIYFLLRTLLLGGMGVSYLLLVSRFCTYTTASCNRRLFRTGGGSIGLGPNTIRPGDWVTILEGGKVPIVLREIAPSRWALIGESYVHGIMQGEAFDGKLSTAFVLV